MIMKQEIDKQSQNKNLHRGNPAWRKGVSGNKNGRPPKPSCLTSLLKDDLKQIDKKTGKTKAQLLAEAMVKDAIAGSASARAEIFERVEGKVAQPISGDIGISKSIKDMTDAELDERIEYLRGVNTQRGKANTPPSTSTPA
jgi:hypothetical protein